MGPGRWRSPFLALGIGLVLLLALAGCGPEAARTRGGGPGADVGNRGDPVVLVPGDRERTIYYETPNDLPPVAAAPAA